MPLTDVQIRNAQPRERPYKLTDGAGLFLLVNPNGSRWWRFKYRRDRKEKLLALGVYPDVSLREARRRHAEARAMLREGQDPSEERRARKRSERDKDGNTFESVAREYVRKQSNRWSQPYARDVLHRLATNIFPALGRRPIGEITAPQLLDTLRRIEARGAHDLAHRVLQVCGQIFRYGIATGRCVRDVSADLRGALTPHRKRHMAAVTPAELPELLRRIDDYQGDRQTRLATQFLALTFVRTKELRAARWDEFDWEKALWTIPAATMKMRREHLVPLSRQALEILTRLQAINGDSERVFVGRNLHRPMSENTILYALYRLGYHSRMTGHGFRTLASTILNEHGFDADAIERQLAHLERNAVRGAYNRAEYLDQRRAMMQWWADHLDELKTRN